MVNIKFKENYQTIGIMTGLAVFFIIIGWVLAVAPSLKKANSYQRQIKDSKARFDIIEEIDALSKNQNDSAQLFIKESERNEVLGKVIAIMKDKKIEILAAEPSETPADSFVYFMISFDVRTGFPGLIGLIDGLKTLKTPLALRYINMGQTSRAAQFGAVKPSGRKEAKLRLEGLMKKE